MPIRPVDLRKPKWALSNNFEAQFVINEESPGAERLSSFLTEAGYGWEKWLPVTTITNPIASVRSKSFEYSTTIMIPEGFDAEQIVASFLDDESHTIKRFFEFWTKEIIVDHKTHTVRLLEDIAHTIIVKKVVEGVTHKMAEAPYIVYPTGSIVETLDSASSELYQLSVNLMIVGGVIPG